MSAPLQAPSDRDLLARVVDGDERALAEFYDQYADRLFDFVARIVRDREAAADVVQATLVKVWGSLQRRPPPTHPKAWLYAIARNEAIDELRRRGRATPTDFDEEFAQIDLTADETRHSHPERAVRDREIAELVWSAAASLNASSYSLLDMHLRQELSIDEIAVVLGVSTANTHKMMSRLRFSLEEAVSVELLRSQSSECAQLDAVVARLGETDLTARGRRAISKHVRSCETCSERKRTVTAPVALFSSLPPVALAAPLRAQIFDRASGNLGEAGPAAVPPGIAGRMRNRWSLSTRRARAIWAGVAVLIVATVILLLFVLNVTDNIEVSDPVDAASTSHVIDAPSPDRLVTITWSPPRGANGYSIEWSHSPDTLPDQSVDAPGNATMTTSPELADGDWYFHLRTQGESGAWTSTVHLGPFVVASGTPEVSESDTSETPTSSPVPITTPSPSATLPPPTSTPEPVSDLIGTYSYSADYGSPTGGCGYSAFQDDIELGLRGDGAAALVQADHFSEGTWVEADGRLEIELTLESVAPETYSLVSTDRGATLTGENTFQDSGGCVTTYSFEATRTG